MRVSVRQEGGLFGVEQLTEVDDAGARLVEDGEVTRERRLDPRAREALSRLVDDCASAIADGSADEGSASTDLADSMATTLQIEASDGSLQAVSFASGDKVPPELGSLVEAILEAPYRNPGSAPDRRRKG